MYYLYIMEITNDIKAKIFALYWGQMVQKGGMSQVDWAGRAGKCDVEDTSFLELTPLSDITDEDMIQVASIVLGRKVVPIELVRWDWRVYVVINREQSNSDKDVTLEYTVCLDFEDCKVRFVIEHIRSNGAGIENTECPNALSAYDYLRSKGYALPYLNWSVDDLVEQGIFKLKNK